ncbi:hypothetical protein Gotri_027949 [Gossypium trilobum]|uniref:RNase H type-1 domain-containing protein n=1 Tax=Gossypium trilobum TaxID=34281 RepID=A0A7J9FI74_9ROSI|nr:hypothetical protein [Gossypium trilobum]
MIILWRALSNVWPLLRENLYWSIGDECNLKELVTESGAWNLDLFRLWTLETIISRIVRIPPLYPTIDGAVKMETGNATFGGVLRDHEGKWILGFNRCLRKCLVFNAELWGIYGDLFILQSRNYESVLI